MCDQPGLCSCCQTLTMPSGHPLLAWAGGMDGLQRVHGVKGTHCSNNHGGAAAAAARHTCSGRPAASAGRHGGSHGPIQLPPRRSGGGGAQSSPWRRGRWCEASGPPEHLCADRRRRCAAGIGASARAESLCGGLGTEAVGTWLSRGSPGTRRPSDGLFWRLMAVLLYEGAEAISFLRSCIRLRRVGSRHPQGI